MSQNITTILLITTIILLSSISCFSSKLYPHYNGILYESPEAVLEAQKKDNEVILNNIKMTKSPVGGTAIVILPSPLYIENNFIIGNENNVLYKAGIELKTKEGYIGSLYKPSKQVYHFLAEVYINEYKVRARGEALKKRGIFDRVSIIETDNPEKVVFNDDYAIVMINKQGKAQWFLKRKKDHTEHLLPIEEVTYPLPPIQKMNLWLDKIEQRAKDK